MKKILTAIVLLAWAAANTAHAQSDTVRQSIVVPEDAVAVDLDEDEVVNGTDDLIPNNSKTQPQQQNLSGQTYINQRPRAQRDHGITPNARMHLQESNYSSVFCELEGMVGFNDVAAGAILSYMSYRWGMYGSFLFGVNSNWGSFGVALRPYAQPSPLDFHLYAGTAFGMGLGYEFGFRFAYNGRLNNSGFAAVSGSLGCIRIDGITYVTIGISPLLLLLRAL